MSDINRERKKEDKKNYYYKRKKLNDSNNCVEKLYNISVNKWIFRLASL